MTATRSMHPSKAAFDGCAPHGEWRAVPAAPLKSALHVPTAASIETYETPYNFNWMDPWSYRGRAEIFVSEKSYTTVPASASMRTAVHP